MTVRTRFAPSPTGFLHIGGLRTALYSYLFAKKNDGAFLLRIEDTDMERYVEGAVERIIHALTDTGLLFDEGPGKGGGYGPYVQSQRKDHYKKYAEQLVEKGGAYYCFCSKERLDNLHKEGHTKYDKHCLLLSKQEIEQKIAAGEKYCVRQNLPVSGQSTFTDLIFGDITVDFKDLEDNVLLKSDGMATYNFANVVDDHLMHISHVIRGIEFLSSTPKYNHLYDTLGWERPKYIHLQPIMRDAKRKLSKRDGAASYEDFIDKGYLKDAIINYIALLGWAPKDNTEKFSLADLQERFDLDGISRSPSIFDEAKLRYINSLYMKELSPSEFHCHALEFYKKLDYLQGYDLEYLSFLLKGRTEVFSDIEQLTHFLTEFDSFDPALFINEKWKTDLACARASLPSLITLVEGLQCECEEKLNAALEEYAAANGYKKGQVLWIFRIALTGAKSTPGGASEMYRLLGKELSLNRLRKCLTLV